MSKEGFGTADFDDHNNGRDELSPQGKNLPALAAISTSFVVPQQISSLGYRATLRFLDFFTANIRNKNTRAAYAVAVRCFFEWLDARGIAELGAIHTHHVAAHIERLGKTYKAPTV